MFCKEEKLLLILSFDDNSIWIYHILESEIEQISVLICNNKITKMCIIDEYLFVN